MVCPSAGANTAGQTTPGPLRERLQWLRPPGEPERVGVRPPGGLVPGGRLEGDPGQELRRHPAEAESHPARQEPGVRRQHEAVVGVGGLLVDHERRRDAELALERELVEELRARVVGERHLGAVAPERLLGLVGSVPVFLVPEPEAAAVQADADGVAPEGPVVLDELRDQIRRRDHHPQVLVGRRVVRLVPEEERVPRVRERGVALPRDLRPHLEVLALLGIRLRAGPGGGEEREQDEAGEPTEDLGRPRSAGAQAAFSFAGAASWG